MRLKGILAAFGIGAVGLTGVFTVMAMADPDPGRGTIVRVVDGDTVIITVAGEDERVRLLNIDTPETVDPSKVVECLGPEATAFLEAQLKPGDRVRLEYDVDLRDRYGRLLAGVFEDDLLVNAEIARLGLGHPVIFEPNRKFYDEVAAAFTEAEENGLGYFDPTVACTWPARMDEVAVAVSQAEAEANPETAIAKSATAAAAAVSMLALIDAAVPGDFSAGGYTADGLAALRTQVQRLHTRAVTVGERAEADIAKAEREAKEKSEREAKEKAEREAKKKAERKAKEKAEREAKEKAEQEAKEKAERKAQEKAEREATEQREREEAAAQEESERRASEEKAAAERAQQQSQIQPLVPQHPAPQPAPAPAPPADVYYANCDAVRAAGAAPIYIGQPGYRPALDRDRDGIGCE